jgi:hypothetical protein
MPVLPIHVCSKVKRGSSHVRVDKYRYHIRFVVFVSTCRTSDTCILAVCLEIRWVGAKHRKSYINLHHFLNLLFLENLSFHLHAIRTEPNTEVFYCNAHLLQTYSLQKAPVLRLTDCACNPNGVKHRNFSHESTPPLQPTLSENPALPSTCNSNGVKHRESYCNAHPSMCLTL